MNEIVLYNLNDDRIGENQYKLCVNRRGEGNVLERAIFKYFNNDHFLRTVIIYNAYN